MADEVKMRETEMMEEIAAVNDNDVKTEGFISVIETGSESREAFSSRLLDIVGELFNQPNYSDLVILLDGERKLWAHKLVLLGRGNDWGEPGLLHAKYLDLSDMNYEVGFSLIRWVYTDTLIETDDIDYLLSLLHASTRFKLVHLNIRCQKELMNLVSEENYSRLYKIAQQLGADLLKDFCSTYFTQQNIVTVHALDEAETDQINSHEYQDIIEFKSEIVDEGGDTIQYTEDKQKSDHNDNMKLEAEDLPKLELPELPKTLTCDVCGRVYAKTKSLEEHVRTHVSENEYTCTNCERAFLSEGDLKSHDCNDFLCDVCQETFQTQSELTEHFTQHFGGEVEKCGVCGKYFSDLVELKQHIIIHAPNDCRICGLHCGDLKSLRQHEKSHASDVKCRICNKKFSTLGNLVRHEKIHRGVKAFKCDECGQNFSQNNDLLRHLKIHSGELEFKCDLCEHSFNRKSTLTKHRRTHTKEKPYLCLMCPKKFTNSSSLSRHIRVHSGEKPFQCEVCFKDFITRSDLNRHSRVHDPRPQYQCDFCNRTFRAMAELQAHISEHSGETIEYIEVNSDMIETYKIVENVEIQATD